MARGSDLRTPHHAVFMAGLVVREWIDTAQWMAVRDVLLLADVPPDVTLAMRNACRPYRPVNRSSAARRHSRNRNSLALCGWVA
jgi:hypothetical protein